MTGFPTAFSEITLVLFTTLAPSGALAYVLANLPIAFGRATDEEREHLDRSSWLLLAVTMVGLVASATHLGNPSNALYVFTAVGKSPLSTEVFCAVVFLALAGVYWLYSFAERPRRRLQRAAVIATNVAALAFVAATAFAYNVGTVPTWSHPLVPISLFANALMGALGGGPCGEPGRVRRHGCTAGAGLQRASERARAGAELRGVHRGVRGAGRGWAFRGVPRSAGPGEEPCRQDGLRERSRAGGVVRHALHVLHVAPDHRAGNLRARFRRAHFFGKACPFAALASPVVP